MEEVGAVVQSTCMEQHDDQRATGRLFVSIVPTSRRPRAYYAFNSVVTAPAAPP
jgi:hypothetical protein